MKYDPVSVRLSAGINRAVAEDSLNDGEVRAASNFLFRRGESTTRPGLRTLTVSGAIANILFAKSLLNVGGNEVTVFITATDIYSVNAANVVTHISSGPAFSADFANIALINGIFFFGNNQSGGNDPYWDPTGGGLGGITGDGRWRFLTSIGTRGFGAYRTAGAATDPFSVGWSDQGDPTNWATGGASTAGSSVLADMSEDITGLCTLRNVAVIPRHTGFHLGYPTGVSFPPFRFEAWNRDGVGVFYPSTTDVANNIMYFVGEDDVYTFDLQQITPIGAKIRDPLLAILRSGVQYRGFISRGTRGEARSTYNLVPVRANTTGSALPHFIYDIYEDNWSQVDYDDSTLLRFGFYRYRSGVGEISFIDSSGNFRIWDQDLPCETKSWLIAPTKIIGRLCDDTRVERILLKHRNFGENAAVKVSINGQLATSEVGAEDRRSFGNEGDASWARTWFNLGVTGQAFEPRIDVDAGQKFSTNYMELHSQAAGTYKGSLL